MSVRYTETFTVEALSRWEAINAATAKCRGTVRIRGLVEVSEIAPGWWKVSLSLEEDT